MPVQHEHLVAVEDPPIVSRLGRALDAAEIPSSIVLGQSQRADRLTRGDAGKEVLLGVVVARRQHRVGGEHDGGEERSTQEGSAHLLENDDQLDVGEARAAELLGNGE